MKRVSALIIALIMAFTAAAPFGAYAEDVSSKPSVLSETDGETPEPDEPSQPEEPSQPAEPEKPEKVKTEVTGIEQTLNESYELPLSMSVKIKPASPARTVKLQLYITSKKKYKTIRKYTTEKAKKAKLKISFPKKYRKRTIGKWRVVVCESENAKKFVSKPITVTTRNLYALNLNAVTSCTYCVETGQVLYGKQMHAQRKQASTTKVMTAVLLIESGRLGGNIKISKSVANTPYGNVYMKAGDVYRLKDMLYAMLLPSSNDSAAAIAEGVWGTSREFVKHMNQKAEELGLNDTHYCNPHGLDGKDNHSSAYDISYLTGYASRYGDFMKVIATSEYSFYSLKYHHHKLVKTTDKLKSYSKRHLGGKTGFTSGAKYCFTSLYKYKGKHYAVTVMGNSSVEKRWKDMKKIYKYINKNSVNSY